MPVESSDITAVVIWLPQCTILLLSVYVQGIDLDALVSSISSINRVVTSVKQRVERLEVVIAGDLNRHDILWGGDAVSDERQGEAEPIIEMMSEQGLSSLLKSGTVTRNQGGDESTIDVIFATQLLTNSVIWCKIHGTNHGSDHYAIESSFDLSLPERVQTERLLFKEAPWNRIREKITELLASSPRAVNTQEKCDRLTGAVLQAV